MSTRSRRYIDIQSDSLLRRLTTRNCVSSCNLAEVKGASKCPVRVACMCRTLRVFHRSCSHTDDKGEPEQRREQDVQSEAASTSILEVHKCWRCRQKVDQGLHP